MHPHRSLMGYLSLLLIGINATTASRGEEGVATEGRKSTVNAAFRKAEVDYVTEVSGDRSFGNTPRSAYTSEIRANMKRLYHDKFGLFVHFGPYAQLEGMWKGEEVTAEWIMNIAKIPIEEYEKYAAGRFKPDRFDATSWVDVAEMAGMKFMVVTAKHHDGFAMYRSSHPYNLVDFAGFKRDIFEELSTECAQRGMNFGFYYSQSQDWHEEGATGNTWDFPANVPQERFDKYFGEKVVTQVKELSTNYGDVFMVWFDTPQRMKDKQCELLMAIIRENQPGALVNSRLGNGYGHFDVSLDGGSMPSVYKESWLTDLKIPWQTHSSVTTRGWGYTSWGAENDRSRSHTQFIYNLCNIVSKGGVYLLNVAPRPDGTIPPSQVDSLRAIGDWLKVNGESIYGADPSPLKFPPFPVTSKPGKVFLHIRELEQGKVEVSGIRSRVRRAYCLADPSEQPLAVFQNADTTRVTVPEELRQPRVTVVVLEIKEDEAVVVDETIQQREDGRIQLPVNKCEYAVLRIGYNANAEVTHRWGENRSQGLIWTVNVTRPGAYHVISEDSGNESFQYQLITPDGTLTLNAKGEVGKMKRRKQVGSIRLSTPGVQQIKAYPTAILPFGISKTYKFKGLELVPAE